MALPTHRFSLDVSRDRLTATLVVFPVLEESEDPGQPEDPQAATAEGEGALAPTLEDVRQALEARGVRFGIDWDAIRSALAARTGEAVVIARGEPPVEGRHGWVEFLFPTNPINVDYEDESKRVDWRARLVFPESAPGQELARLHPPVEGVPGRAVTGEEIPPPRVLPARLLGGPGVEVVTSLTTGTATAVATQPGMPAAVRQGRTALVKVEPLFTFPGDVDLGTGNLKIRGSVAVQGNIREGCTVIASDSVVVRGDVETAEVAAGRDVTVAGQVVGARLRAGGGEHDLRLLMVDFDRLVVACRQLESKGLTCADAVRLLLQTKFAHVREALSGSAKHQDEQDWIEAARNSIIKPSPALSTEEMEDLSRRLHLIYENESSGNIKVAYVQNAHLQAAGSVVIGRGCFFANILAGGDVIVEGTFRAGRIVAGGNVRINEAGSEAESHCEIEVPKEATVSFKRVHPGVVVRFGPLAHHFESFYKGISLRAGPEGVEFF